jgi:hypothetical protein
MAEFDPLKSHYTSISLLESSARRIKAALCILERNGVICSQSELLRLLAKMYLQSWRGEGDRLPVLRRYNARRKRAEYVIMPWYIDQVLRAALWQRSLHTGISVSRMLDFAVRIYLPRLVESMLCRPVPGCGRAARNSGYWNKRLQARRIQKPDLFISYSHETLINRRGNLNFADEVKIIPKTGLSPIEIAHLHRTAA